MEPVRKKISIEKSKSRTNGVLPYIPFNSDPEMYLVSNESENGNWGMLVSDIGILEKKTETGKIGLDFTKEKVVDRVRYCDIIKRYNEANRIIESGIRTKCVVNETNIVDETVHIEQMDGEEIEVPTFVGGRNVVGIYGSGCGETVVIENKTSALCLTDLISEEDYSGLTRYDFIPVDSRNYAKDRHIYGMTTTEEDIEQGKFYVIVDDYDELKKIENWWFSAETEYTDIEENKYVHTGKTWCLEMFEGSDNEVGLYQFMEFVDKYVIGKIEVPYYISGIYVPDFVFYTNIQKHIDWFEKRKGNKSEQGLKEWNEHGGDAMYNFLKERANKLEFPQSIPSVPDNGMGMTFVAPYISFPISIEQECSYETVYESYIESKSAYTQNGTVVPVFSAISATVESKLYYVIDDDAETVEGLVGAWVDFPEEGEKTNLLKCTYYEDNSSVTGEGISYVIVYDDKTESGGTLEGTEEVPALTRTDVDRVLLQSKTPVNMPNATSEEEVNDSHGHGIKTTTTGYTVYNYKWWECTRLTESEAAAIKCADGESAEATKGKNKYRTVTILECFKNMVLTPSNGDTYYFMVKRDNGYMFSGQGEPVTMGSKGLQTFRIPYTEGSAHNIYEIDDNLYVGDYVNSIEIVDSSWTITYTIGAKLQGSNGQYTYVENTGIQYQETYPYEHGMKKKIRIDGRDGIVIYYDKIDTESTKKEVYSEEYGTYRMANLATIIGMEIGTMFNDDDMFDAPVFTREDVPLFMGDTKSRFSVTMDRGSAAAFERHFKLSECNSMEDLENYGNNYYNL